MHVSIIIVNYNTFTLTCNCIRSVMEFTNGVDYEIILVDNASVECDPKEFTRLFPQVKLIVNKKNSGFASGNNLGISVAKGNFILLLNSDVYLKDDAISRTVSFALSKTDTGVVGCRMIYPDGSLQFTARRFRSIKWELLDLFRFIPYMIPYDKRADLLLGKYFRHDIDKEADWVNGAFFLFPREILNRLPGHKLDERFFMYGEDHLWCWQIKNLNYKVFFYSGSTIVHISSGSSNLSKQINLKKVMMKNELEIMRLRANSVLQFQVFKFIYTSKELTRIYIKKVLFFFTNKIYD